MYKGPFNWFVQSVLPVVFDNSLSYYEVLAKLTKYIENLTSDVAEIEKILDTIEGIEDVTEFTRYLESIEAEIGVLNDLSTSNKDDLVSAINEVAQKANQAYVKPSGGIPESDLSQGVKDKLNSGSGGGGTSVSYIINNKTLKTAPNNNSPTDLGLGTYSVPEGGIPWDTLSEDVQNRIEAGGGGTGGTKDYTELINKPQINGHTLNAGNNTAVSLGIGTYSKPSAGIPESDLSAEVQEKLNTSGGIADSETSFVATRDYEAGELIYINGTLYKTKYNILSGTNLIPGNNIEETDISAEIESINSKIDAMASGEGLDSWTLRYDITIPSSDGTGTYHNFFEYVSLIGGESYLFIITPTIQQLVYDRPYSIRCIKRDGTVVKTENVNAAVDYENQHRFTFAPNETGEYYFSVNLYAGGLSQAGAKLKIELEYAQSQGMTELWNKVNEASQLEPRVNALETLTGEHQTQLEGLTDIPTRVETLETDVDALKSSMGYRLETEEINLDTSDSHYKPYSINYETSEWITSGSPHSWQIDNPDGDIVSVTITGRTTNRNSYVYLLKSIDTSQNPDFVDPETPYISVAYNTVKTIDIPTECKYVLILDNRSNATSFRPSKIEYTKKSTAILKNTEDIITLNQNVSELKTDIDSIIPYIFGTSWENNYNADHLLTLPNTLTDENNPFPIPISISKMGNVYGHNINIRDYVKNNITNKTYYVSPVGDDTNDGLDSNAPLFSITAALSKTDVNTIILLPGVYLNGTHFTPAPITKAINIIGIGKVVLKTNSGNGVKINESVYVENIIFDGGDYACDCALTTEVVAFNRCVFSHAYPYSGVHVVGGRAIFWECIAEHNHRDGFSYSRSEGYSAQAVEIKCKGSFNGENNYTDGSCNGSTAHNSYTRVIRIGCDYYSCRGGVVADTSRSFSLNIGVNSFSTQQIESENRNCSYMCNLGCEMWLYDCGSFGSIYDIISNSTSDGIPSTVHTTKTYSNEETLDGGLITRIE